MGNSKKVYSVTQISLYIKSMFEQDFLLDHVSVSGEISGLKYHSSGHIYFNLKDDGGILPAVMWASTAKNLKIRLNEGDKVLVTGAISVYEKMGRYQLIASRIETSGTGELFAAYLKLKQELEEAGYFDASYKKPIPKYVTRLGIVTAETGAAVHDMISISKRRNPYVNIYFYPARVQGAGAASSVIEGIRMLDSIGVDVIIIGRGGGSIEDLWEFNNEELAKAIFNCDTPIVSAVGHETDYTIADFVADLRAPTPSAAAELCVYDYEKTMRDVRILYDTASSLIKRRSDSYRSVYANLRARLLSRAPENQILLKKKEAANYMSRMTNALERRLQSSEAEYTLLREKLDALSPLNRISKGYALVLDKSGKRIKEPEGLLKGDELSLYMGRSKVDVTVENVSRY